MDNVWGELTKDLNTQEDWAKLHDDQWNQLIDLQNLEDSEIDSIVDEWIKQQEVIFQAFE